MPDWIWTLIGGALGLVAAIPVAVVLGAAVFGMCESIARLIGRLRDWWASKSYAETPNSAQEVGMPEQKSAAATLVDGAQVLNRAMFGPGESDTNVHWMALLVRWEDGKVSVAQAGYDSAKARMTKEADHWQHDVYKSNDLALPEFVNVVTTYEAAHPTYYARPPGSKATALLRTKAVARMAQDRTKVTQPSLTINGMTYAVDENFSQITNSQTMKTTAVTGTNVIWKPGQLAAWSAAQASAAMMLESAVDPTVNASPTPAVPAEIVQTVTRTVPDLNCFCGHRLTSHVQNSGPTEPGTCVLPGCTCEQWRRVCAECGTLSYPWRLGHTKGCVRGRAEREMLELADDLSGSAEHNRPMRTSIEDIPEDF